MLVFWLVWSLYLLCGGLWINWLVLKNKISESNVIASLLIISIWPAHLVFELIRYFKKRI
jgi:hypothetical protein